MTKNIITVFKNSSSESVPIFRPEGIILEYLKVGFEGSYQFQNFDNFYAQYSKIEFFDNYKMKLKKRIGFKQPKLEFPVVEFLNLEGTPLVSIPYITGIKIRWPGTESCDSLYLPRGIPVLISVDYESRYARFSKMIWKKFTKMDSRDLPYIDYGWEWIERPKGELEKLDKMIQERKQIKAEKIMNG